jgi:hypothetical protein
MTASVDLASIEQWRSGPITGRICLVMEAICFPESEWSDFLVVILAWWLVALEGPAPVLRFMDGPFSVVVNRETKSVQLMRGESVIETRTGVDAKILQHSVRRVARSVVARCDQLGIKGTEVEALRERILPSTKIP